MKGPDFEPVDPAPKACEIIILPKGTTVEMLEPINPGKWDSLIQPEKKSLSIVKDLVSMTLRDRLSNPGILEEALNFKTGLGLTRRQLLLEAMLGLQNNKYVLVSGEKVGIKQDINKPIAQGGYVKSSIEFPNSPVSIRKANLAFVGLVLNTDHRFVSTELREGERMIVMTVTTEHIIEVVNALTRAESSYRSSQSAPKIPDLLNQQEVDQAISWVLWGKIIPPRV